jgi:hypothetical protein
MIHGHTSSTKNPTLGAWDHIFQGTNNAPISSLPTTSKLHHVGMILIHRYLVFMSIAQT